MSFRIVTCLSPKYAGMSCMFLPSWYLWSGAESVTVRMIDGGQWYRNIALRVIAFQEEILAAAETGGKLLCLDLDVFVLRELEGGFSDRHPISIARFPAVNAGAVFYNTAVPFPWEEFFEKFNRRLLQGRLVYEAEHKDKRFPRAKKQRTGDQLAWVPTLQEYADYVHPLDEDEWNLCSGRYFVHKLVKRRNTVRIAHVKAHGRPLHKRVWAVQAIFPDKVGYLGKLNDEQRDRIRRIIKVVTGGRMELEDLAIRG